MALQVLAEAKSCLQVLAGTFNGVIWGFETKKCYARGGKQLFDVKIAQLRGIKWRRTR